MDIKEQLKIAYDKDARRRDSNEGNRASWKLGVRQRFADLLEKEHKSSILELGSGAGLDAKYFQDRGFKVLATDLSSEMVNVCKNRGLDSRVLDLYGLSSLGTTFDAIFSMNVLLHVPKSDLNKVLTGIHDVLNETGIFYYGVYGGVDKEETIADESRNILPRFFSYLSDKTIEDAVKDLFDILDFQNIKVDFDKPGIHFQSLLLRKK